MDEPAPLDNPRVPGAVPSGVANEPAHHDAVGAQEIVRGEGVQVIHELVGATGVGHLEDLISGTEDALAVEDGRDGLA